MVPAARLQQQQQKAIKFRNSSHQNKGSSAPRMRTRGENPRNMHTQNQPTDQAPRHTPARLVQLGGGGTPNQKSKMLRGVYHASKQTRAPRRTARLHSALLRAPAIPFEPSPCGREGERAAGPGMLTSRTLLRPPHSATSPVGLQALGCLDAGLERKAARVPPCARRDTGLDGKPRGSHPAGRGGLSRLAGPAPAGFPCSGCVPGSRPQERERKIGLAFCSPGYSIFLPDSAGALASVQRWRQLRPRSGTALWLGKEAPRFSLLFTNS